MLGVGVTDGVMLGVGVLLAVGVGVLVGIGLGVMVAVLVGIKGAVGDDARVGIVVEVAVSNDRVTRGATDVSGADNVMSVASGP
jgi:hypothetical protein